MGYFKDIGGIFTLKDDTYRKVANDKKALGRLFYAYLLSAYLTELVVGILGVLALIVFAPFGLSALGVSLGWILVLGFIAFLLFPLIGFALMWLCTLIPYVIGLIFGLKSNGYNDFFKTVHYTMPVQIPFQVIFSEIAGTIFGVWHYFMLFKTYKIVGRMNSSQATGALVANILLAIFVMFVFAYVIYTILAANPAYLAGGSW